MNTNGHTYLEALRGFPPKTFENRFSKIAMRLRLETAMNVSELKRLFDATFSACLCNISFNGLGGCNGEIRSDQERNRIKLERQFMAARDILFKCEGWRKLGPSIQGTAERIFLSVRVDEENLAAEP